eukprot:TRINITY_DN108790_c0_g1_i1.p1 TRINITY_DN108790_c0_g1~~TRINITY_DN108790_c0_g1_i1.p1  ORF type:complete len:386 (+),score=77.54 TRINITY_DN108790_c0_g1_i1:38-1195(+)
MASLPETELQAMPAQAEAGVAFSALDEASARSHHAAPGHNGWQEWLHLAQRRGLRVLELLTCGCLEYADRNFAPHMPGGAAIYIFLASLAAVTEWLSLTPRCELLPLAFLSPLAAAIAPWHLHRRLQGGAALACTLLAEGICIARPDLRVHLWNALACLVVASELLWWQGIRRVQQATPAAWYAHNSTHQTLVVTLWLWPQLLQLDPRRWQLLQEAQKAIATAPAQTKEAVADVGISASIVIGLPLLACGVVSTIFAWRQNRAMCLVIFTVYISFIPAVALYKTLTWHGLVSASQVPLSVITVAIEREQLRDGFGNDTRVWMRQAPLLALLLLLSWGLVALLGTHVGTEGLAAGMLMIGAVCKGWIASQGSGEASGDAEGLLAAS